jgi:glutathionylspermidine synthase
MNQKKFLSPERTAFFEKSGLPPFWDSYYEIDGVKTDYPYMLYTCHKESKQNMQELQRANVLAAEIFDLVANRIYEWDEKELEKWGFPKHHREFLNLPKEELFCMRIGWAWKNGHPALFEINAEAPTLWIEPEMATPIMTKNFGLRNPNPRSNTYLKKALNQAITKSLTDLSPEKRKKPMVGFVCHNDMEDIETMRFLANFCEYTTEVFPIDNLDFTIEDTIPFNRETGQQLDALIFWDVPEWLEDRVYADGETMFNLFIKGLTQRSFALVHAIPAYFAQSKGTMAYITEHAEDIFVGKYKAAEKYFPKTYLSPQKLGKSYIAKPIWGRQGQGCYLVKDGQTTKSRYQNTYYANQKKIYQELLTIPKITVEDEPLNWVYESWVYKVDGKYVPGATGLRGCNSEITDDFCYFMPIGI